jgi:hypothetical protein
MQMLKRILDYTSPKATFLENSYQLTKIVDFALCAAHMSQHCGRMWGYVG